MQGSALCFILYPSSPAPVPSAPAIGDHAWLGCLHACTPSLMPPVGAAVLAPTCPGLHPWQHTQLPAS